ncbi:MAG: ABC transporter ATP-binding protein [Saprospiraceae bacterium]|jgi:ABC-type multidrug transport system ATPase subunit
MDIQLDKVGKRYNYEWIFRGLSFRFAKGRQYAIGGPNGSGKSTLIKVLSGHLSPSTGSIAFFAEGKKLGADEVYRHISLAAPYIDLIEEFTLREMVQFHTRLKPLMPGISSGELIEIAELEKAAKKEIRHFSSGMKQRLKLALAFCSETPLLLLDEPTSNLDDQAISWYRSMVERFAGERTLVVASNAAVDFDFCEEKILITDYKQPKRPHPASPAGN